MQLRSYSLKSTLIFHFTHPVQVQTFPTGQVFPGNQKQADHARQNTSGIIACYHRECL